jgi:hypothetical protein
MVHPAPPRIDDISRAFIAVLNAPRELVHNEVFNAGRRENYRIQKLPIRSEIVRTAGLNMQPTAGLTCAATGKFDRIAEKLPEFQPQ